MNREEGRARITELVSRLDATFGNWELYSEWDTVIGYLVPLLHALGWDTSQEIGASIHFHGYADKDYVSKGLPDCVLYSRGRAYAVIEAKRFSYGTVDKDPAVRARLQNYADELGCQFQVLTRVYESRVYDRMGEPIMNVVKPSDYLKCFNQLWELLSKDGAGDHTPLHSSKNR